MDDNRYLISLALAGFSQSQLEVETHNQVLIIRANKALNDEGDPSRFLHRGIANRTFERRFQLADYVNAVSAKMENGLLVIELIREVPEAMKPRKIAITQDAVNNVVLENKQTAN